MDDAHTAGPSHRMAPLDQVFWKLQRHAPHRATLAVLAHLEGAVDPSGLVEWHHGLIAAWPRLACRVADGRRPRWEPDPHFRVERHVSHVAVPYPPDDPRLDHLVHNLVDTSFPPDTAPWQAYLMDGPDGNSTYLLKIAHALTDGLRLVDLVRGRPSHIDAPAPRKNDTHLAHGGRLRRALRWRRPAALLLSPGHRPTVRASAARQYASFTFPLEQLRRTALRAPAGSVNDVLMHAIAHGLARYRARYAGESPRPLSVLTLVGRWPLSAPGVGNDLTFATFRLSGRHDGVDSALRETRAAVTGAGGDRPPDVAALAARISPFVPGRTLVASLNRLGRRHDFMITNVPAGRRPFSIAGAPATAVYGVPPLLGTEMVTAVVPYRETCHLSVVTDPARITDIDALVICMREALAETTS
ncbi:wax ester/triacylglycerol synthase domain-containing protein [Streptomyces ziwulingensis]